ncbi:integumentary mucin B.1 [Xenopus tropicalis]|uniref:Integumentary mucin B.1 n=1 Tax=Xenopus tropicalis TaxID=8364 RepID=A0A8J1JDZ8_XENTR|nr:integumentary mucin B.1 [Xenopus tropicalis]
MFPPPVAGPVVPAKPTIDISKFTPQTCCGPSGLPVQKGQMWQTGCDVCTCNGTSGKTQCVPRHCEKEIICKKDERRVLRKPGKSCCGYCEPLTCRHNGIEHKLGATFKDGENPCITYRCDTTGLTVNVKSCPNQQFCTKSRRSYDPDGCCYSCDTSCKPVPAKVGITAEYGHERQKTNCSAIIAMTKCSGECEHVLSYDKKEDKVVNMCKCCKATHTETRDADLACENGMTKTYKYKHITTCKCIPCTSYNDKI